MITTMSHFTPTETPYQTETNPTTSHRPSANGTASEAQNQPPPQILLDMLRA